MIKYLKTIKNEKKKSLIMGVTIFGFSIESQASELWLSIVDKQQEEEVQEELRVFRTMPIDIEKKEIYPFEDIGDEIENYNFNNDEVTKVMDVHTKEIEDLKIDKKCSFKDLKINKKSLYDYSFYELKTGIEIPLSQYKGQIHSEGEAISLCKYIINDYFDKYSELKNKNNKDIINEILNDALYTLDNIDKSIGEEGKSKFESIDIVMKNLATSLSLNLEKNLQPDINPLESYNSYIGKVVMIVNTASKCQLSSQLIMLNKLHKEYKSSGLVIIGVPSNNFGGLEPGSMDDVVKAYTNLDINFIMTQPVVIGGEKSHPLYEWAAERENFGSNTQPKWNFHKYLFSREGQPVVSFQHLIKPNDAVIKHWIENALYAESK